MNTASAEKTTMNKREKKNLGWALMIMLLALMKMNINTKRRVSKSNRGERYRERERAQIKTKLKALIFTEDAFAFHKHTNFGVNQFHGSLPI